MTDTGGKRPFGTAQNWSRKDGIRAGSVTGPWRSVGRTEASMSAPSPHRPESVQPQLVPAEIEPPAATIRAISAPLVPQRHAIPRKRRNWTLSAAVSGLTLAAAATFLLPRQAGVPESAPPVAAALAPAAQAEAAVTAPVTTRLSLRIGSEAAEDRVGALLGALHEAGFGEIAVTRVPFQIGATRIGYFHEGDLAAAEAVRSALASEKIELRNFGAILPAPPPGSLDLWIEG